MTMWQDRPINNEILPFFLEARDEDYDTYLFWPSLSNGTECLELEMSFAATYHRPSSPLFDHVDYFSGWDIVPSSPLPSTPSSDLRFPSPREDQTLGNSLLEVPGNGVQEKETPSWYNNIFRMGLLLTQSARHVDRAVQSVGMTLRKTKPRGRAVESGMRKGDRLRRFGIDSG